MTFSIVGGMGDAFGVAVASKFLSVGALVPAARIGVGAVATQAMANISYKGDVLRHLQEGAAPTEAVARVTTADPEAAHRQLGVVSSSGQASFTGAECLAWAGGTSGADDTGRYAIQGNILVGPQVVEAAERAWLEHGDRDLPKRLLAALLAGDEAGGDARGRQGAALYAVQPGSGYDGCGVLMDVRVDDHPEAPRELTRLAQRYDMTFGRPEDVQPLVGELAVEVTRRLEALGYQDGDVAQVLAEWASVENYEMRLSSEGIDAKVLAALRAATG